MTDILFDKRNDGVALITLNRPDALNAMGGTLMDDLAGALRECASDEAVRCVAVTGAGRGFCAGGDMKGFAARASGERGNGEPTSFPRTLENSVRGLRASQRATSYALHTMPKPTVALVNGPAAGAGMSLALSPDLRLFSDKGRLVPAFARIAFSGDYGGSYYLSRLIGYGRAREAYFLGDPIDAPRALELGIANRVVPHDDLLDEGLAYCAKIASGPPAALARMKANFLLAEQATLGEALDHEALNMTLSGMTNDNREGILAFVEKRTPNFTGA